MKLNGKFLSCEIFSKDNRDLKYLKSIISAEAKSVVEVSKRVEWKSMNEIEAEMYPMMPKLRCKKALWSPITF